VSGFVGLNEQSVNLQLI